MTNYLIIKKKIRNSMKEAPGIFLFSKLKIGSYKFSLDDIEHGILRSNAKRLKLNFLRQFSKNELKRTLMVDKLDFYSAEKIEGRLQLVEESFCEQGFLVDDENRTIEFSQIFSWYKEDFEAVYLNDPKYSEYKTDKASL